jgi:hypothetical protein
MLVVDVPESRKETFSRQFVIADAPQFGLHCCAESVRVIGALQNRNISPAGIILFQSGSRMLQFLANVSLSHAEGSAVLQ